MAERPIPPQFLDDPDAPRLVQPIPRAAADPTVARPAVKKRGFLASLDIPVTVVVTLLLAIGGLMVYSTTFFWSYTDFGSETHIVLLHLRNMAIGAVFLLALALIDYRIWKRFAVLLLLLTIGVLIAVLIFSDQVFGARRSFIGGSYQPGELAELIVIVYMAAWLGSKNTKVHSFFNGMVPFLVLLGVIGGLVMLQPDLSTAATIFVVASVMYFLAGANIYHLVGIMGVLGAVGYVLSQRLSYTEDRITSFTAGLSDLSATGYHAQQAIIAFLNGGWTGMGLGQGTQKFFALPAPHTDSIFAVIGEELGVLGAGFVVLLFIIFVFRGLQIARRSNDPFGALLAAGITLWIITKALLNIAVMLSLVPPTGVALPFISYGGSSLVTVMAGAGLLLSVARVSSRPPVPEGKTKRADHDRGWGNRWSRLSGDSSRRGTPPARG
jgi:cell division protein FtsW